MIEKVHLDDLDLYVITFIALATSVLLWSSVLKLTKKFNSTSFNLKQEVVISPDEDLLFEVETSWVVSFNTDDQSKTDVANAINVITYTCEFIILYGLNPRVHRRLSQCVIAAVFVLHGI